MRSCPKCRKAAPAGVSFCGFCGSALAPPAQVPPIAARFSPPAPAYPGASTRLPVYAGGIALLLVFILNAVVCNGNRSVPTSRPVTSAQEIAPGRSARPSRTPKASEEPEPAWVQTVRDIQSGQRPMVLPGYKKETASPVAREEPPVDYTSSESSSEGETYYAPSYPRRSGSSSWNSADHPRDSRGRFIPKSGGSRRRR